MIIAVQNLSTLISSRDAYDMTLLVNRQARDHVAPAWGIRPPQVEFLPVAPSALALPAGHATPRFDAIIGIMDDADQAGALGWHAEGPDASVYGRVFARPVLDNGGDALAAALSVCSVLSHEVAEVIGDSACNRWAQRADGLLVAMELADPVEGDSYRLAISAASGEQVAGTVSDFVLPSWFDPDASAGATDFMGLVTAPFQVRPAGYAIIMSAGSISEQWGEQYPEWRRATKDSPLARTYRRAGRPVPLLLSGSYPGITSGIPARVQWSPTT